MLTNNWIISKILSTTNNFPTETSTTNHKDFFSSTLRILPRRLLNFFLQPQQVVN